MSEISKPRKAGALTVRLDDDLADRVGREAARLRISQSDVVRLKLLELPRLFNGNAFSNGFNGGEAA